MQIKLVLIFDIEKSVVLTGVWLRSVHAVRRKGSLMLLQVQDSNSAKCKMD